MIPKQTLRRLMLANGVERVSSDALDTFQLDVEEYAASVAETAAKLANHAGRKTVNSSDIKLAI